MHQNLLLRYLICAAMLVRTGHALMTTNAYRHCLVSVVCENPSESFQASSIRCAMLCSSTTGCAGYIKKSNMCVTCHKKEIIKLTFVCTYFKISRQKETAFNSDYSSNVTLALPSIDGAPTGNIIFITALLTSDSSFRVYFESSDSQNVSLLYAPYYITGNNSVVMTSKAQGSAWDEMTTIDTTSILQLDKTYDHCFWVARDGFHVYVAGQLLYTFPHRYPPDQVMQLRVTGRLIFVSI